MFPNIEAERARLGMSKLELSEKLCVSYGTLKSWLAGRTDIPASKVVEMSEIVVSRGNIKEYLMQAYPDAFKSTSYILSAAFKEEYRGIADILNGLSGGITYYGYGHPPKYWAVEGNLEKEAWAQFGRTAFENNDAVKKTFEEIFPNLWRSATIALKGVV